MPGANLNLNKIIKNRIPLQFNVFFAIYIYYFCKQKRVEKIALLQHIKIIQKEHFKGWLRFGFNYLPENSYPSLYWLTWSLSLKILLQILALKVDVCMCKCVLDIYLYMFFKWILISVQKPTGSENNDDGGGLFCWI